MSGSGSAVADSEVELLHCRLLQATYLDVKVHTYSLLQTQSLPHTQLRLSNGDTHSRSTEYYIHLFFFLLTQSAKALRVQEETAKVRGVCVVCMCVIVLGLHTNYVFFNLFFALFVCMKL